MVAGRIWLTADLAVLADAGTNAGQSTGLLAIGGSIFGRDPQKQKKNGNRCVRINMNRHSIQVARIEHVGKQADGQK